MDNDFEFTEETNAKGYSVKIDGQLSKRLDKHIKILKHFEQKGLSKQKWVMDAINEMLAESDHFGDSELSNEGNLVLKINDAINNKIEAKVEVKKKLQGGSYSKKKWLVEAIQRKLEKEESKAKEYLDEMKAQYKS